MPCFDGRRAPSLDHPTSYTPPRPERRQCAELGLFGVPTTNSSSARSRGARLSLGGCYHADAYSVPQVFYSFTRSKVPPVPKLGIAANCTVMVVTKRRISRNPGGLNNGKFDWSRDHGVQTPRVCLCNKTYAGQIILVSMSTTRRRSVPTTPALTDIAPCLLLALRGHSGVRVQCPL